MYAVYNAPMDAAHRPRTGRAQADTDSLRNGATRVHTRSAAIVLFAHGLRHMTLVCSVDTLGGVMTVNCFIAGIGFVMRVFRSVA